MEYMDMPMSPEDCVKLSVPAIKKYLEKHSPNYRELLNVKTRHLVSLRGVVKPDRFKELITLLECMSEENTHYWWKRGVEAAIHQQVIRDIKSVEFDLPPVKSAKDAHKKLVQLIKEEKAEELYWSCLEEYEEQAKYAFVHGLSWGSILMYETGLLMCKPRLEVYYKLLGL